MEKKLKVTKFSNFESKLIKLRDRFVLLDKDVAELYQIELNEFPKDYAYQVSDEELDFMGSQNVIP